MHLSAVRFAAVVRKSFKIFSVTSLLCKSAAALEQAANRLRDKVCWMRRLLQSSRVQSLPCYVPHERISYFFEGMRRSRRLDFGSAGAAPLAFLRHLQPAQLRHGLCKAKSG